MSIRLPIWWLRLILVDNAYIECDRSPTFPTIEKAKLYEFLEAAFRNEVAAEINLREWVRSLPLNPPSQGGLS